MVYAAGTMRPRVAVLGIVLGSALLAPAAGAQWLNHPTPGLPTLPDGTPNLRAPAPRAADGIPDLSGIWAARCGVYGRDGCFAPGSLFFDLAQRLKPEDVQPTPWAAAIQQQRSSRNHVDDPYGYCLPPGTPRIDFGGGPFRIVQTPQVTVLLYETLVSTTFRQVFTDGRRLPEPTAPSWLGYSIGRWDGDAFVVETTGFRDGGWLDTLKARTHSDALRVTERFRRVDFGRMDLTITIDDPKAYLKPWTITTALEFQPNTDLVETACDGHEKTMEHRRVSPPPAEPPSPARP
jgi:hypothetical protein